MAINNLISVIIPLLNRENFIGKTIESVLNQSYPNWECIVVDDGSADNGFEFVKKYVRKDKRIQLFKRPVKFMPGGNGARNYGLTRAKGEYIQWLDSDDQLTPSKFEKQINIMETNPQVDGIISQTASLNTANEFIYLWKDKLNCNKDLLSEFILKKCGWSIEAPLWKKSFLQETAVNFNEILLNGQDYDYHIKLLAHKPNIKFINDILTFNYLHNNQIRETRNKYKSKFIINHDLYQKFNGEISSDAKQKLVYELHRNYLNSFLHRDFSFIINNFNKIKSCSKISLYNFTKLIINSLPYLIFKKNYRYTKRTIEQVLYTLNNV